MNLPLKPVFALLLLSLTVFSDSMSQQIQTIDEQLSLSDQGRKIENSVSITTSHSNYGNIKAVTGQKISVKATLLVINGDTLDPSEIATRGQSSLYFRRKSYSFNLKSEASFSHGERTEAFKKFNLISLSMDKNYCNNRLAFEMMGASHLFNLFYSFCELRINDQSEGICMVIERPEDWAMKKKKSPLVIRRGYNNSIAKIRAGEKTEKDEAEKYRGYFRQIYRSLNKYEGEELYNVLSNLLDLDFYMKWLSFNYFVRNGDYTDEVYFYIDKDINKFRIIPWDYDDLFSVAPHEGSIENKELIGGKLFFSTEDLLDRKIVSDPYLYNKYLVQFEGLINQLSADLIKRAFENTYAELYPYYLNEEIISKSEYDLYKETSLLKLNKDMSSLYDQLLIYRRLFLTYLESKIR